MSTEATLTIRLHSDDNVVVARTEMLPGVTIAAENLTTRSVVPAGHKIATSAIATGQPIRKFGQIIGFASESIDVGEHVHVHNVEVTDFDRDYAVGLDVKETLMVPEADRATFQGYVRKDGHVGTRNYIGLLTSVNCSATVAHYIAEEVERSGLLDAYPNIDGVVALTHGTGCGMADTGEGYTNLQRTLWGYARNPNFGGILMVGLGCEVNRIDFLLDAYGIEQGPLFQTMNIQDMGGTRLTVADGVKRIAAMAPTVNEVSRTTVPVSKLVVALQCGGSDAYSGITANPALGRAVDRLVAHGGTGMLAETPEIYGAEHLLTRRAVSPKIADTLISRIKWWEAYCDKHGGQMNNNPSPGNKAGGLTTILEKSLGAAAKGGTTNLTAVYRYAERVETPGFIFMDTPGYDPVAVTGQIAGGSNLVCFTTGRGSVAGYKPVPSIKLGTNTPLYERMSEDMDINCGTIIDGTQTIDEVADSIFQMFIDTASGKPTKSEAQGFGKHEFVPWQIGAVM
jgi:altronate hydrolase